MAAYCCLFFFLSYYTVDSYLPPTLTLANCPYTLRELRYNHHSSTTSHHKKQIVAFLQTAVRTHLQRLLSDAEQRLFRNKTPPNHLPLYIIIIIYFSNTEQYNA